ncbi:MAG: LysE family translocator [Shimia sp.]
MTLGWATLGLLVAVQLAAVASPGPSFVVSLRVAMRDGAARAALLALGFGVGAACWALAAMLGLAVLFEVAPVLFTGFKIAGGLFLAFIGLTMWRHATAPMPSVDAGARIGAGAALRVGVLTALANPKIAVFFGAVFAGLLPPGLTGADMAVVLVCVFVVEAAWYALLGLCFTAAPVRRGYGRAKAWIDRGFGTMLAAMGLRVMVG